MAESSFQKKVVVWLRQKGCFVIVMTAVPGVPDGTPDVIALIPGGGWAALECKASDPYKKDGTAKKGAFRPLQQVTVKRLDDMFYSRVVYPENWSIIQGELQQII